MPKIQKVWSIFKTWGDDKDEDDGITEIYKQGGLILGRRNSNFKSDHFRKEDPPHQGEVFDISVHNIDLHDARTITYDYEMDNNDGWEVAITIEALCDDGKTYGLGGVSKKIGNGEPRFGTITLGAHL